MATENHVAQGLDYMRERYGPPLKGWCDMPIGWYDKGGYIPAGTARAHNATGQPEPVFSPARNGRGFRRGAAIGASVAGAVFIVLLAWTILR